MGRAYSNDLRERVSARVLLGEPVRSVAALYSISPSAVVKWSQHYRRTGSVAPGQIGGYKRKLLAAHRDFVQACFSDRPDAARVAGKVAGRTGREGELRRGVVLRP